MNVYPSDTDVRQGLAPVTGVVSTPATRGTAQPNQTSEATDKADAASQQVAAAADKTEARDAARKMAEKVESTGSRLKIRVLENASEGVQVEIVDGASDKVLRKIPQDEILKLSASIKKMTGLALDQPA